MKDFNPIQDISRARAMLEAKFQAYLSDPCDGNKAELHALIEHFWMLQCEPSMNGAGGQSETPQQR